MGNWVTYKGKTVQLDEEDPRTVGGGKPVIPTTL